jgi:hypothetical protein
MHPHYGFENVLADPVAREGALVRKEIEIGKRSAAIE